MSAAMLTGLLADRTADLLATPEARARLAEYDTDPSSPGCLPPAAEATTGGDTR